MFIFFDADRLIVHTACAGGLARSRTDAGCKLRKIIGFQETAERLLIIADIDEVIPLRTHIVQRTPRSHAADHHTGLAKRHAAVHTARCLASPLLLRHRHMELMKILDPLKRRRFRIAFSFIF